MEDFMVLGNSRAWRNTKPGFESSTAAGPLSTPNLAGSFPPGAGPGLGSAVQQLSAGVPVPGGDDAYRGRTQPARGADVAANGGEALKALADQPYDLVLMDMQSR